MFPKEIWSNPRWCLYDALDGRVVLKYPFRDGLVVPCPHCGNALGIASYKAFCCGHAFRISHGEIAQTELMGHHNRAGGSWASLRSYTKAEG